MNGRILELIKNPDLVEHADLKLLQSEIENKPYAQSIRALYLYGVHKHNADFYPEVLSETAAYTTDKKIIYQFINKIPRQKSVPFTEEKAEEAPIINEQNPYTDVVAEQIAAPKPVFVNGEVNRILFEGEEDFLEREHETIDVEQSQESGMIITHTVEKKTSEVIEDEIPQHAETSPYEFLEHNKDTEIESLEEDNIENQITEINIGDEVIETKQPEIQAEAAEASLNFHGSEEFLPNIKIAATPVTTASKPVAEETPSKHELEMQRLIAEVEAKMKKRRRDSVPEPEPETMADKGLDFADVQNFEVKETVDQKFTANNDVESAVDVADIIKNETDTVEETSAGEKDPGSWKPMSFSGNTPDALIEKQEQRPEKAEVEVRPEIEKQASATPDSADSVFNISFFTQDVTSLETTAADDLIRDIKEDLQTQEDTDSNVPEFINTWQKWLKIERAAEPAKTILNDSGKKKVIENFIVNEPKISKLKEESDFVVKERGDNISHLMTETLAKLYVEQKLYAKAIKGYQILTEKYPERKSYFEEQIQIIRDLRQNKQP